MSEDTYRVWVEDLGTFVSKQTKHVGPKKKMEGRRNSLQAFFNRNYGDGMYRVYIEPSHPADPPIKRGTRYHVYDRFTYWQGIYDEETSEKLVNNNRDWTRVEINESKR